MTPLAALLLLPALALGAVTLQAADQKRRVIVLTDIENEPDDTQSMIRFLLYSNQWDVEALIATTSIHQRNKTSPESIRTLVRAYGRVHETCSSTNPASLPPSICCRRCAKAKPVSE